MQKIFILVFLNLILFLILKSNAFAAEGPVYNFNFNNYAAETNVAPATIDNTNVTTPTTTTENNDKNNIGLNTEYWTIETSQTGYKGLSVGVNIQNSKASSYGISFLSGTSVGDQEYGKNRDSDGARYEDLDESEKQIQYKGASIQYAWQFPLSEKISYQTGLSFSYLQSPKISEDKVKISSSANNSWAPLKQTVTYNLKSLNLFLGPSFHLSKLIQMNIKGNFGYAIESRSGSQKGEYLTGTNKTFIYGMNAGITINI